MIVLAVLLTQGFYAYSGVDMPPPHWDDRQGNPVEIDGQPRWRLDRLWPDKPEDFTAYRPMLWDAEHADWRPTEHMQENMPSARVDERGVVHFMVGGPIGDVRFNKIAALTFIAPEAGTYGVTGTARGRVAGGYGLPPTTVLLIKRADKAVETIREWSLNQNEVGRLDGVAVDLDAGEELSLVIAAYQARTRMLVTLKDYRVSTKLADAARRRLAGPASPVLQPTPQDILDVNRAVIHAGEGGVVYPASSGIRNVKAFGAKGDGVHDDTAAIQAAYDKAGLIYFPNGTYLISDTIIAPPRRGSAPTRRIIQGQSRDGVILRLVGHAAGFDNPQKPKAMLVTSYGVAQAFRNSVRDMTFEVGAGNAGAIGVDFFSSNTGNVRDLVIRSLDPEQAGYAGLMMHGDSGPSFVQRLRVEGFDYGVISAGGQSQTLEDIHVTGQRVAGFAGRMKTTMHRFTSDNTVPGLVLTGVFNNILDATLTGGNGGPAIVAEGPNILLRDIRSSGYDHALEHDTAGVITGERIDEWTAVPPVTLGDAKPHTLRLPIKDAPVAPRAPLDQWVNVQSFQPQPLEGRKQLNWAPAIQAAFNDGRSTVYLEPGRKMHVNGTMTIPAHVKRFIGMEAELRRYDKLPGRKVRFITEGPAEAGPLVFERTDAIYGQIEIVHRSARPLIIRSVCVQHLTLERGAGDVFIEDSVTAFLTINGQNVWARQHDPEFWARDSEAGYLQPHVLNNGGNYWCLGFKTEQLQPKVYTINRGSSEVYAYVLSNRLAYPQPMFLVNHGSRLSLSLHENVSRNTPFDVVVRLVKGKGEIIDAVDVPRRGRGATFPLLVAE